MPKMFACQVTLVVTMGLALVLLGSGCGKPAPVDTANWTKPQVVAKTEDALITNFALARWNHTLLALDTVGGPLTLYFLNSDSKSWTEKSAPNPAWNCCDFDPAANRFVACSASALAEKLDVTFLTGTVNAGGGLSITARQSWRGSKPVMFGPNSGPNVSFGGYKGRASDVPFWGAAVNGPEICIPYCIRGETYSSIGLVASDGPFDNGVFYSTDSGVTWKRQHISHEPSAVPNVVRTKSFTHYIAESPETSGLWYCRTSSLGGGWTQPETLNQTTAHKFVGYRACVNDDIVHLCWLDRRHEKKRAEPLHPNRENYEIAYRHRKDPEPGWSDEIILSQGFLYSYCPTMAVEGDRVVVAWSGVQDAPDGHSLWSPNDIFYVTSKDAGKNWTQPSKVTDGEGAGLTAGKPTVELSNGVIHLFYVQGKMRDQRVSPGLRLLNQPPWPIYYQQRPFPS
jgi:hypothetical protein